MRLWWSTLLLVALGAAANAQPAAGFLTKDQALRRAVRILMGNPYGQTFDEVNRTIKSQDLTPPYHPRCGNPRWQWVFNVATSDRANLGQGAINGWLCIDAATGAMTLASLPYLD